MFPLQLDNIPEDLISDHDHNFLGNISTDDLTAVISSTKVEPLFVVDQENKQGNSDEQNAKRITRREIERQRRQEMANLYATLRSLLPLSYIRGKRSTSDHMQGAVNYIKDIQNNIQELQNRRDKLKKLSNLLEIKVGSSSNNDVLPNSVTVNPCLNGMEILMDTKLVEEQGFTLSRVLKELLNRRLNVVSCVSTKVNERLFHRIQFEANDISCLDISELQERLAHVINCNPR